MLHGLLHLAGMDHETDGGAMARAEARWRKRLGLPSGLIERAKASGVQESKRMTLLLTLRPRPSRFWSRWSPASSSCTWKACGSAPASCRRCNSSAKTIEPRIGLETERGALTFSLVKHIGLGILGCLIVAITIESSPLWEALAGAFLLTGLATVLGAHLVPQIVYRKTTGQGLAALVPVFRILAL